MSEDWAAVGRVITRRLAELGLRQSALAERSRVSQATIRELQYNAVQRRRSSRTLEALSVGLGWHPGYLAEVVRGEHPDTGRDDAPKDPVLARLEAIENQLRGINERLGAMDARLADVVEGERNSHDHY